ncbi:MAG: C2H2-type zinc finger protein, partial [Candidatus Hodarchaeota archaeon]
MPRPKKICDICNKPISSSNFAAHRRIHTGEKPYVCKKCGYATGNAGNFTVHQRACSGEKPYVCKNCGYATGNPNNFTVHQRA